MIVNALVARYGWRELGDRIKINCFRNDPSVKSSLKFLRRTPWARAEVEARILIPSMITGPLGARRPPLTPWLIVG